MPGQLAVDERVQKLPVVRVDRPAFDQQLAQGTVLGRDPGLHGRQHVVGLGEFVLKGQKTAKSRLRSEGGVGIGFTGPWSL